ncbi:MAG: pilus assembly protein PilP [Pseudomonadota bacterium]
MLNFLKSWIPSVGVMIFLVMAGCDSPQESAPPPSPVVVTGSVPGAPAREKAPGTPPVQAGQIEVSGTLMGLPSHGTGSGTGSPVPSQTGSVPPETSKTGTVTPEISQSGNVPGEPLPGTDPAGDELPYDPEGKLDPFAPLINTEKTGAQEQEADNGPQRILTPLEKLDFSQMRLVAVVQKGNGNIAMVEESGGSNKGYIIQLGTFMGKNGGKVVSILNDRIIIEETIKNFKGERVTQFQEMKLHKSENED